MADNLPDAPWLAKSDELPDAPWAAAPKKEMQPGAKQALSDEEIVAKERGFVPDPVKAGFRSGAEAALFGAPVYGFAAQRAYSENIPFQEALKKERAYQEALSRQNPLSSAVGTGAGILAGTVVPVGVLGTAATRGAQLAGRLTTSPTLRSAASGAILGGGTGAVSGALEKFGTEGYTAEDIARDPAAFAKEVGKSGLIGAGTGAVLSPIVEKALAKTMAPEVAAKVSTLESQGIKPSREMVTGVAAPEGMPSRTAAEMSDEAKRILTEKQQSIITPGIGPDTTAEALGKEGRAAFLAAKQHYEDFTNTPGVLDFGATGPASHVLNFVDSTLTAKGINPNWTDLRNNYPGANDVAKTLQISLQDLESRQAPLTIKDFMQINDELKIARQGARNLNDRQAADAIIAGFKNSINDAVISGIFQGGPANRAAALGKLAQADKSWSEFKKTFEPSRGSDTKIFNRIMKEMIDPNTGYLADTVTPQMTQAAQNIIDANIIHPRLGPALYSKLESTLGSGTPAMDNLNAMIRNNMMKGELKDLPSQITQYTQSSSLPVTLRAFGAKDGNLRSLDAAATDTVETAAAKQKLLDLQNMGKAIEIINKKPISDEKKQAYIMPLIKKYGPTLAGAALGFPHGIEAAIGALAGKGLGETASGIGAIRAARAQRAGAPRELTPEAAGMGIPVMKDSLTMRPVISNVQALEPTEREPGYGIPRQRASGGRVMTADDMIAEMDKHGKKYVQETKPLLKSSDTAIAKALEVANQHI